jgi:hypothetical protein
MAQALWAFLGKIDIKFIQIGKGFRSELYRHLRSLGRKNVWLRNWQLFSFGQGIEP